MMGLDFDEFDAVGGRRVCDLRGLVEETKFWHIFVIVGDNNAKFDSVLYILRHYHDFINAVWPVTVRFSGDFNRGDFAPRIVEDNDLDFHGKLGSHYKRPMLIKYNTKIDLLNLI